MRFFHLHTLEQFIVLINVPKSNLFPKHHISKHYRTHVKCRPNAIPKTIRKMSNKLLMSTVYI